MKKKFSSIPMWLLPLIIIGGVLASLFFYGDFSYQKKTEYESEIKDLEHEIAVCEDSAAIYRQRCEELNTNPEQMEKIAREKYGMKRPNEEVYQLDIK